MIWTLKELRIYFMDVFHDNGNAMIEADKEFMVKKQS